MKELTFKVPMLPQSINSLYKINYAHRVMYMSDEGRMFKETVKKYMPPSSFPPDIKYSIKMFFHGNWKYKNGKNKRADIQNLIKLLIDAVFEKLGVDDSYVYYLSAGKTQDTKTFTRVVIEGIDVT